jgi:hypothetical protein
MEGPTLPRPLGAAAVAVLIACLALLSACGGGEDFASKADAVCTEQAIRVNGVLGDGGTPTSGPEAAAQAAKLVPIERDGVSGLRAIETPSDAAGAFKDFLGGRELALRLTERRERAAMHGAGVAYAAINERRDRVVNKADADARRAGLLACAERLSGSQVRAVEAAIIKAATSSDPLLCSESFTANFVRSQFGGPGECRRRQKDSGSAAESVDIGGVRGIDGVYALAVIVPRGGGSGGQRLQIGMLYEDGAYRADSLGPRGG